MEVQQGAETAVSETETQHITQAQIATLAQVTGRMAAVGVLKRWRFATRFRGFTPTFCGQ